MSLLDWIKADDILPLIVLSTLLTFIGQQISRASIVAIRMASRTAAAVFFGYTVLGIWSWGIASVGDLLLIVIRALLAAWFVYSVAVVTIPPIQFMLRYLGAPLRSMQVRMNEMVARQKSVLQSQYDRLASAQRERHESKKRQKRERQAAANKAVEEDRAEKDEIDRQAYVDAVRDGVVQFYKQHSDLLSPVVPQALFETRLRNKFYSGISSFQADIEAEEMLTSFLPLIEEGKARQQNEEQHSLKKSERARRSKRLVADLEDRIESLESSPIGAAEDVAAEIRETRKRLAKVKDQLSIDIDCNHSKGEE